MFNINNCLSTFLYAILCGINPLKSKQISLTNLFQKRTDKTRSFRLSEQNFVLVRINLPFSINFILTENCVSTKSFEQMSV